MIKVARCAYPVELRSAEGTRECVVAVRVVPSVG